MSGQGDYPDTERLKATLMEAEIENKRADTRLKNELARWEPWKALATAFGAGLAVATALITAAAWILSHLIQLPPGAH